jgi:hypothetical protein
MSDINQYNVQTMDLPLQRDLGGSITDRTTSSPRYYCPDGATVRELVLPRDGFTLAGDLISVASVVMPFAYNSQTAVLPYLRTIDEPIIEQILPSQANLVYGVPDGTSGFVIGDVADINYGVELNQLSDSGSSSLPALTKIGSSNFVSPADLNLGEFYGPDGPGHDQLASLMFMRDGDRSVGNYGAVGVQRPVSQWVNAAASGGGTHSYGITILTALANMKYVSTCTVGPNEESGKTMKFWIKKGTDWFGDFIVMDNATNEYLKGDRLPGIVDLETQTFLEDYEVDTSKWLIKDNMTLTNASGSAIVIVAGTILSAPVTVSASFVADVGDLSGGYVQLFNEINDTSLPTVLYFVSGSGDGSDDAAGANIELSGGTDRTDRDLPVPSLRFVIPERTQYFGQYSLRALTILPGGFCLPKGTVTSGINVSHLRVQQRISFDMAILMQGFNVESDIIIGQIVTSKKEIDIVEGSKTLGPVALPLTASWAHDLLVDAAIVSSGYVLQGDIKIIDDTIIRSEIVLNRDSKIGSGSILPGESLTDDKMKIVDEIRFASQTSINSDFNLNSAIMIDALNPNTLVTGTIIRALGANGDKTQLPVGMILTNGSSVPGPIKVSPSDLVTLKTGLELKVGVQVGPSFTFGESTQFQPSTEFTVGTVLGAGTLLPSGTELLKDSKFQFPMPLPVGLTLPRATKLFNGTVFAPGANLPATPCRPHEDPSLDLAVTPFRIVSQSGQTYIVYRSGTVFGAGFQFPKATVLLVTDSMGAVDQNTAVFNSDAYDGGFVTDNTKFYDLEEGEFRFLTGGAGLAIQSLRLDAGVPTQTGIQLRGEASFGFDVAIPFVDNSNVFAYIAFDVDFVLRHDVTIDADLSVNGDNLVFWPTLRELPQDLILVGELSIGADSLLTRKVKLPNAATCYLENVLSASGSFIKMPNIATTLKHKVRIGETALVVGPGVGQSKSYVTLPTGMYINTSYLEGVTVTQGLKLRSVIPLEKDWKLLEDLSESPAFLAQGIFLPNGSVLPGSVNIGALQAFPKGLTLPSPAQLAASYVVGSLSNNTYTLPVLSKLTAGSILKKGSIVSTGCKFSNVILGPVDFNTDAGLYLLHDQSFSTQVTYSFFFGNQPVYTVVDYVQRLQELEMLVAMLQSHH